MEYKEYISRIIMHHGLMTGTPEELCEDEE